MRRPDGIDEQLASGRIGLAKHASPVSFLLLGGIVLTALLGRFGGGSRHLSGESPAASLALELPDKVRNGEIFELRLRWRAHERLGEPVLRLAAQPWHDTTLNALLPEPVSQAFEQGELRFAFDPLEAGEELVVRADFQANPRLSGGGSGWIRACDGERVLVELPVELEVLP